MSDFETSIQKIANRFPDDDACAAYLADRRWPGGFVCPECGGQTAWRLKTKPWTYECARCHTQTSMTAGTIMHRSKLPLTTWFTAAYLISTHGDDLSIRQLQRWLGLGSYQSAWRLYHTLRRALHNSGTGSFEDAFDPEEAGLRRQVDQTKVLDRVERGRRDQRQPNPKTPPASASEVEALLQERSRAVIDAVAQSSSTDDAISKVNASAARAPFCPHCGRTEAKSQGRQRGLRRFWCSGCGRSFSAVTGTPLERLRRFRTWWAYAKVLKGELNLKDAAEQGGVAINTLRRLNGKATNVPS